MSRSICSQSLSLACLVTVLVMSGCTALDNQYHAFTDKHEHDPELMKADDATQGEEMPEAGLVAQDEQAETQREPVKSAPVDGIALKATTSQAINTSTPAKTGDWEYHPDSRDEYLAAQEASTETTTGRVWQDPLITGYQPDSTHKALNDYAAQLAMKLMRSAKTLSTNDLIGVASFVRLNTSLQETTIMGNQLSELLIAELQGAGMSIVDFKIAGGLTVTPHGDLAMTRSGEALSRQLEMDHILTGTLIEEPRGVRVNARVVSVKTGRVVGSSTLVVPAFMVARLNNHQG